MVLGFTYEPSLFPGRLCVDHTSASISGLGVVSNAHIPGCFAGGMHEFKMVIPPFINPEPPRPATARPTINIGDEVAAPQISEPISNRSRKARKDH